MRMPTIPAVSIIYTETTDRGPIRVYNRWLEHGRWHTKLLFEQSYRELIFDGIIYSRYSPNYRYYYEAAYEVYQINDTRLWIIGQQGERVLKETAFECVFSPDSRWLAGCHKTYSDKIAFFKLPELRETVIPVRPYTYSYFCGWYPDSRRFWYGSWKGWYRLRTDNLRGRPERLSKQEYARLFQDWDLLNPRFRTDWAELEERKVFYCYSLRGTARARAYPSVLASVPQLAVLQQNVRAWRPQVVEVQRRDGRRYRVVSNRDERVCLKVAAVSDDGQWVLVVVRRWDEARQREGTEWRLYEVARRRVARTWTEQEIPSFVESVELGIGALVQ